MGIGDIRLDPVTGDIVLDPITGDISLDSGGGGSPPAAPVTTYPTPGITAVVATITVAGTGVTGDVISVYIDGTLAGATVVSGGVWSFPVTLVNGPHSVYAVETNGFGNSPQSTTISFIVAVPLPLIIYFPSSGQNVPISIITIFGTGVVGDVIDVYLDTVLVGIATVGLKGIWFITGVQLTNGSHTVYATDVTTSVTTAVITFNCVALPPPYFRRGHP